MPDMEKISSNLLEDSSVSFSKENAKPKEKLEERLSNLQDLIEKQIPGI